MSDALPVYTFFPGTHIIMQRILGDRFREGEDMNKIMVSGGVELEGETHIQGSKNAALPIMAAALLVPGVSVLENVPHIADVECMCALLQRIGCRVSWQGEELVIDAEDLRDSRLPKEYVTRMRSSVMLMGPVLGRLKEVSLSYPGGCVIGERPIDLHLSMLRGLGVVCRDGPEGLDARAERMQGGRLRLSFPSVGATENAVMAAVAAEGATMLAGCAREPEIHWLCEFLRHAGADIREETGGVIRIRGGRPLQPCRFRIPSDRIVAGTYVCACLAAGGSIHLKEAPTQELGALLEAAGRMGASFRQTGAGLLIWRKEGLRSPGAVETAAYPGFPTDLQSPLLAVMAEAAGAGSVEETIFSDRFRVAEELNRMGVGIRVEGNTAYVPGGRRLKGAGVLAQELRGGAALVVAGLAADGITVVENRHFIDRGYEDICRDLRDLGAQCAAGIRKQENDG